MKVSKSQIHDEIYRQVKKMIFEQVDQPDQAGVGPYDKIKQLAELGKKIEQQVMNSFNHLNAFMTIGSKTEDSFEFKRAVAEIGRIQKLTADYSVVITKAHELAESAGDGSEEKPAAEEPTKATTPEHPQPLAKPAPVQEAGMEESKYYKKDVEGKCRFCGSKTDMFSEFPYKGETIKDYVCPMCDNFAKKLASKVQGWKGAGKFAPKKEVDMKKANAVTAANKPPKTPKPEPPVEDDAELLNKGGKKDWYEEDLKESRMGDLAIEIDELAAELNTTDPNEIAKELHKRRYSRVPLNILAKFAADWLKNGKRMHEYGVVLKSKYDETIKAVDVKAKSLKEAALLVAQQHPTWEVKHLVEKDEMGSRPDVDAFVSDAIKKKQKDDSILNTLEDQYGLSSMAADAALERGKKTRWIKNESDKSENARQKGRDAFNLGKTISQNPYNSDDPQRGEWIKGYQEERKFAEKGFENETLPAPTQGDQGTGLAMPPDKHEMQEEHIPLETDSGSMWYDLTHNKGMSDAEAREKVFQSEPKNYKKVDGKWTYIGKKYAYEGGNHLSHEEQERLATLVGVRRNTKEGRPTGVTPAQLKQIDHEIEAIQTGAWKEKYGTPTAKAQSLKQFGMTEEAFKVTDSKGQEINVRDRVADQVWNPNKNRYEQSKTTFWVEKLVSPTKIIVKDLGTGKDQESRKSFSADPKDFVRIGATHASKYSQFVTKE